MKSTTLLTIASVLAASTVALGLAASALALPAFTLATSAFLALILVNDYAPGIRSYAAVKANERLPFAA